MPVPSVATRLFDEPERYLATGERWGVYSVFFGTEAVMPDRLSPIEAFLSAFSVASIAGLAAYLRSKRELTVRGTVSAMLNSGLLGLAIAFLWYTYFNGKDNIWFLLGISLLTGLGGITMLDFVIQTVKKGGLDIKITTSSPEDSPDDGTEADDDDDS